MDVNINRASQRISCANPAAATQAKKNWLQHLKNTRLANGTSYPVTLRKRYLGKYYAMTGNLWIWD